MRAVIAATAVALVVFAVVATAGIEDTLLHGVEVGEVHVSVSAELPGLSRDLLQSRVESQLREAGIHVTPGAPARLFVDTKILANSGCFATVDSSLVEEARLVRNGRRVPAQSWHRGALIAGQDDAECAESIPVAVERTVHDFVEMYTAMNPSAD